MGIGACIEPPAFMGGAFGYCQVDIREHRPRLRFQPERCHCKQQDCAGRIGGTCSCLGPQRLGDAIAKAQTSGRSARPR